MTRVECIKTCENMSIGQRGTLKRISSSKKDGVQAIVELDNGGTVRVPSVCCKFVNVTEKASV